MWPAQYELENEVSKGSKMANLDPNHTHFILVDNGTYREFGTEITFRGLLEKKISQIMTDGDEASATNVPVVSIVVEGGPGTLTTVRAAIDNATPVVILEVSAYTGTYMHYLLLINLLCSGIGLVDSYKSSQRICKYNYVYNLCAS